LGVRKKPGDGKNEEGYLDYSCTLGVFFWFLYEKGNARWKELQEIGQDWQRHELATRTIADFGPLAQRTDGSSGGGGVLWGKPLGKNWGSTNEKGSGRNPPQQLSYVVLKKVKEKKSKKSRKKVAFVFTR